MTLARTFLWLFANPAKGLRLHLRRCIAVAFALALPMVALAEGIGIRNATVAQVEDGWQVDADFDVQLSAQLEEAINRGVPLYFVVDFEMARPRWYWFDEKAVSARQTVSISYDVLTRQYNVYMPGSLRQSWGTLDEAMFMIRRPNRWLFAPKGALEPGKTYTVTLRMFMDRELLQKPLQVNAFNNADWRLTSSKKTFTYKAE